MTDRGMRVLFVINGLGTGGAERSLAEMLPALAAEGIEPSVVCLFRREEGVQEGVLAQGFDVRFLSARGPLGRIREVRGALRRDPPNLLHTTIFEADVTGRLAAAGLDIPVTSSLVNTSYEGVRLADPGVRRSRLEAARMIDGWTARHLTSGFHALTQAVADSAVRSLRIDPRAITVIPRGREPGRLGEPSSARRTMARRTLSLSEDHEVLLTVGRQEFQKGHKYLLEALSLLSERPRLVLLVAGRAGGASGSLQRLHATLGLGDRVRFLGHRQDVPDLLAAADVFVFPSLYEGFGGAALEAMALGVPVVGSALPALQEAVEPDRTGLLVTPGDPGALAGTIRRVLDDPVLRARLGRQGRHAFLERFTVDRVAERMVGFFRSVAGEGSRLQQKAS